MSIKRIIQEEFGNLSWVHGVNGSVGYYLDKMVESCLMTEDRKPDMEWDFQDIKTNIDKSKMNITSRGEIITYLEKFFSKIKNIPTSTKKTVIKYVLISFLGIMSIGQLTKVVNQVTDEHISISVTPENKLMVNIVEPKEVIKQETIREPSENLTDFLKYGEGSAEHKGDPVLTAYDINDGSITIGWGHAEKKGRTKMVAGKTTITKEQAEKQLQSDIDENSRYVNNILNKREKDGINVNITQGMYDAMTSMMFNMGVGNFRHSEFIQLVKRGEMSKAKEKIKTTNVTNKGHIYRRQKESERFGDLNPKWKVEEY